jgi:hypothetical protein
MEVTFKKIVRITQWKVMKGDGGYLEEGDGGYLEGGDRGYIERGDRDYLEEGNGGYLEGGDRDHFEKGDGGFLEGGDGGYRPVSRWTHKSWSGIWSQELGTLPSSRHNPPPYFLVTPTVFSLQ